MLQYASPFGAVFRLTRTANCIVKTFSLSSHLFWRPGGATQGSPSPRPSKLTFRESFGLRCQPSVLRPLAERRPQEDEAAPVGDAPRGRRGRRLPVAARPPSLRDGESGLEEPSARSLRQLYIEIYTRGPSSLKMRGNTSVPLAGGPSRFRSPSHCGPLFSNGPDAPRSTKGLIRQDSLAYGACGSSVEECFGVPGCPGYRALGCLAWKCGECCKAAGSCSWHAELERKKKEMAAKMNL